MKTKIEIEVDIPDGYEATGKFRTPGDEDVAYIDRRGDIRHVQGSGLGECEGPRIILRIDPDEVKLARHISSVAKTPRTTLNWRLIEELSDRILAKHKGQS